MGFIVGIIKKLFKLILYFIIFVAFIVLIPNLPPYTKFTSIEIEPTQERVGALAPNVALNNAKRLYEDKLLGPEAFQIWNDEVYTSLATGEIVKLTSGGHVTFVTKIGQPCTGLVQEHICGRPLGFEIDEKNKFLYAADAYHGIWKINLNTDKKQLLVSPRVAIKGKTPKLFNDLAVDKNGDVFWTESSSDFQLKDGMLSVFSDPNGRLLHYNAAKNESKVLLDKLWFPNGVIVSADNQFVLVSETNRYRLIKYYVDGPKKGSSEVFVAGLPGIPDNLRPLPDGSGILIALYNVFDDEHPLITKTMSSAPLARKFLSRFFRLIEIPVEFLNSQVPHYIFEELLYKIGNFASMPELLAPSMAGLVQIDWNGKIVASYYNNDSSIKHISDAVVFKDKLYMGSPHNQNFVAVVPAPPLLKKAFSKAPQIKEQPKVVPAQQTKPKVQEKQEVPKATKPVAQNKPLPSEKKPKQTTPPSEIKVEKQPEVKPRESQSKPNVPKNTETPEVVDVKPKVVPKETSQKPITKENAQPKVTEKLKDSETKPKQPEYKPKVVSKEPEKPKVVSKEPEKPKVVSKEPEKPKVVSKEPEKPKVVSKEPEKPKVQKQEEPKTKPVSKQAESKPKSKEAEIKSSTIKESKPTTRTQDTKSDSQKASEKINKEAKKVETSEPKTPPKPIPVEEIIPSDTAKPNKEKLKVIKKSGPQEIPNPHL